MTRSELEQWISAHYDQLMARAARAAGGEDAMQAVLARLLETPAELEGIDLRDGLEGWLVTLMNGQLKNQKKKHAVRQRITGAFIVEADVLGQDAGKDTRRDVRAARNQRARPGQVGEAGLILASGASTEAVCTAG